MGWNYRVLRHASNSKGQAGEDAWYAIHEVYYRRDGVDDSQVTSGEVGYSADPVSLKWEREQVWKSKYGSLPWRNRTKVPTGRAAVVQSLRRFMKEFQLANLRGPNNSMQRTLVRASFFGAHFGPLSSGVKAALLRFSISGRA